MEDLVSPGGAGAGGQVRVDVMQHAEVALEVGRAAEYHVAQRALGAALVDRLVLRQGARVVEPLAALVTLKGARVPGRLLGRLVQPT